EVLGPLRQNRAPASPARSTASSSARNLSSLAVKSCTTWRLEIARPSPVRTSTIRRRSSGPENEASARSDAGAGRTPDDPRIERDGQRLALRRLPGLAPIERVSLEDIVPSFLKDEGRRICLDTSNDLTDTIG